MKAGGMQMMWKAQIWAHLVRPPWILSWFAYGALGQIVSRASGAMSSTRACRLSKDRLALLEEPLVAVADL